jgi:hypothetical protein
MLGFFYLFATAKPVSIRNLTALFVIAYLLARVAFGNSHNGQGPRTAMEVALVLTAVCWTVPVFRLIFSMIRSGQITLHELESTSAAIKCTYVVALVLPASPIAYHLFEPTRAFTMSTLFPFMLIALLVGVVVLPMKSRWTRQGVRRVAQPSAIMRGR